MTPRILVCDDHEIVREAIGDLLADRFAGSEINFAADFIEACERAGTCAPDVALCDLDMPGASPFEGIAALQAMMPGKPVLILTGSEDDQLMLRLLSSGVSGFVSKNSGGQIIASALHLALAGGRYFPPRLLALLENNAPSPLITDVPIRLTDQQRRVLSLVSEGRQNKVIAQMLNVAPSTIKSHLEQAMRQLGASNRYEATNKAQQLGLICLSGSDRALLRENE
jgi:DNA-binding NarL/FixJ family response regulator